MTNHEIGKADKEIFGHHKEFILLASIAKQQLSSGGILPQVRYFDLPTARRSDFKD